MINKNIKKLFNKKDFDYIAKNIKLNLRPSELRPEIFYKITEFYEKGELVFLLIEIIFSICL